MHLPFAFDGAGGGRQACRVGHEESPESSRLAGGEGERDGGGGGGHDAGGSDFGSDVVELQKGRIHQRRSLRRLDCLGH